MPALVNSSVGSLPGTSGELATMRCSWAGEVVEEALAQDACVHRVKKNAIKEEAAKDRGTPAGSKGICSDWVDRAVTRDLYYLVDRAVTRDTLWHYGGVPP